ncbi:hypothetical protein BJ912DRAFT_983055, partial [Pholiota molesta]
RELCNRRRLNVYRYLVASFSSPLCAPFLFGPQIPQTTRSGCLSVPIAHHDFHSHKKHLYSGDGSGSMLNSKIREVDVIGKSDKFSGFAIAGLGFLLHGVFVLRLLPFHLATLGDLKVSIRLCGRLGNVAEDRTHLKIHRLYEWPKNPTTVKNGRDEVAMGP